MKPEVSTPSLSVLSFMLRHKETWPSGFEWNFRDCWKCAMGLSYQIWNAQIPEPSVSAMKETFNMPYDIAWNMFTYGSIFPVDITPEIVADRIDSYLATLEA